MQINALPDGPRRCRGPRAGATILLSTGVTLTSTMMQRRAFRTRWRFGTRTCSVSNDVSHNRNDNNGGNHAASTPFHSLCQGSFGFLTAPLSGSRCVIANLLTYRP